MPMVSDLWSDLRYRVRALVRRSHVEQELDDELRFHLERETRRHERAGVPRPEAWRRARVAFGGVDAAKDQSRDGRGVAMLETCIRDLRFAVRTLGRRPLFTLVAAFTLALGIGASAAMFSLVDGILLRPLPYPHPDRLVEVLQSYPERGLARWTLSPANVVAYRDGVPGFQSMAAHRRTGVTLDDPTGAVRLVAEVVSANFFDVLGTGISLGRSFTPDEGRPGAAAVAILSYGIWQSRFGGDRRTIGSTVVLDGQPTRIVGIAGAAFAFPRPDVQAFLPLVLNPAAAHPFGLRGIARLRPGVTLAQARQQATAVMWEWTRRTPGYVAAGSDPRDTHMAALVTPLRTAMTGDVARPMAMLQAAVLLILLIAIANVATLLSARASARGSEMAMRTALGASRGRLIQQLLTESVVLAILGGVLGVALAVVLVDAFANSNLLALPRLDEVTVSWRVLACTLTTCCAAGVLFGLAPARESVRRRSDLVAAGGRSGRDAASRRVTSALVVAQIGLSLVLLLAAGLVLVSFHELSSTNLGFEPAGVLTATMPLPPSEYMMGDSGQARNAAFASSVVERAQSLRGVRSAAVMFPAIYANDVNTDGYIVEGQGTPASGSEAQAVQIAVSPGLFATLGIPLRSGRPFTAADRMGAVPVTIVDDVLAKRYWPDGRAVGRRIRTTGDTTWLTIVGVVGDVRDEDVATRPRAHMYFPYAQAPGSRPTLVVRPAPGAAPPNGALRRIVRELDRGVPLDDVRPLTDAISRSLASRRIAELLLGGFAAVAVVLASLGLYGVLSLQVTSRRREFGVRLALGASPSRLAWLVVRDGLLLACGGVAAGVVVGFLATHWARALLYGVSPADPRVYAVLGGGALGLSVFVCLVPAFRAARSDPLLALRSE
jgi:putative ABC transport system permease protein